MSLGSLPATGVTLRGSAGFEPNKGQFRPDVLYGFRSSVWLGADRFGLGTGGLSVVLDGANRAPQMVPSDTLPYVVNVFRGTETQGWVTSIPRYREVNYKNIYPGIDLVFASLNEAFTFRFVVSPGANISDIRLHYDGAVFRQGTSRSVLVLDVEARRITQSATATQDTEGGNRPVTVEYASHGNGQVGFTVGNYDSDKPLVIENVLSVYGSSWGGQQVVSQNGTLAASFAEATLAPPDVTAGAEVCGVTTPPFRSSWACRDIAVAKYSPNGDLLWITYLQGKADEVPGRIAVDGSGVISVAGQTNSADFPGTAGGTSSQFAGPGQQMVTGSPADAVLGDVVLARLDGNGRLLHSSYVGGPEPDTVSVLQLDASGNAYIGGPSSRGWPVTAGALRTMPCVHSPLSPQANRPCDLGYVVKFNSAGRVEYSTYLPPAAGTMAVDPDGFVYIGGQFVPDTFTPATINTTAAFVSKLDKSGGSLVYTKYYRDNEARNVFSMSVDSKRNVWIAGSDSGGWETSWMDGTYSGYLAKIDATGSTILYQTPFIGGRIAVDSQDRLSVYTQGFGSTLVRTPGGVVTSVCGSMMTKLGPGGEVLLNRPAPHELGFQPDFNAAGELAAYRPPELRITPIPAVQGPDVSCALNSASLSIPNVVAPGQIITIPGRAVGPRVGVGASLDQGQRVPTSLAGVQVMFDDVPVPLLWVSEGQINAIAPFSLVPGSTVSIVVRVDGKGTEPLRAAVVESAPALFSASGSGAGQVLAINQDGSLNSPQNPASLGSVITVFANGTGATNPASVEGAIAHTIDARPVKPPSVILAGPVATQTLYAGPSPGSLSSVTQLNVRLPQSLPQPANFPLTAWPILFYDGRITQMVTIALKP